MLSATASESVKRLLIFIKKIIPMNFLSNRFLKAAVLILLYMHGTLLTAQQISQASQTHYKQFMSSVTYVVEDENPFSNFNAVLEKAMQNSWHLTTWQSISTDEFEKLRTDVSSSFIFLSEASSARGGFTLNILNIVMGAKSADLNKMPDLGSVPLSYVSEEDTFDEDHYAYKLEVFLRFMQSYIQANANSAGNDFQNLVKENAVSISSKEIWFLEEELSDDVNTVSKISQLYTGNVKIVSLSEIEKAIEDKNPDVLILHKIGPEEGKSGKCLKFILSVENGMPYYFNMTDVNPKKPDAFLSEDFKKL
jgi:hypothetical protein